MLVLPLVVYLPDMRYSVDGAVVFISVVPVTIPLVFVDYSQNFCKFLFRVRYIAQNLVVECENLSPPFVCGSAVIKFNIFIQPPAQVFDFFFQLFDTLDLLGVELPSDPAAQTAPRVNLDFGDLQERQHGDNYRASRDGSSRTHKKLLKKRHATSP